MLKKIVMVTLLICLAQSEGAEWTAWNTFATQYPFLISGFRKPPMPENTVRYEDHTLTRTTYQTRANQYRYLVATPSGICNVYCGLRSFLTSYQLNATKTIYLCQRDMSSNFWGKVTGAYQSYCVPDVDVASNACNAFDTDLQRNGRCNPILQAQGAYQKFQCCYNDNNPIARSKPDITMRFPSSGPTSFFSLRQAES